MNKLASPSKDGLQNTAAEDNDALRSAFTGAAINMSWQLAVVTLVLIFGGYKLDSVSGHSPYFTVAGLVLSVIASILIIKRAMLSVNNFDVDKDDK